MTLMRFFLGCAALFALLLAAPAARAYPQFVFKGYGDCGSCHHSPSGGGFPNRWGLESIGVTFGAGSELGPLNDDLSFEPGKPAELKVDLGADLRLLPLFGTDGDGSLGPALIPMLTEVGGAAALGRFTLYGGLTARKLYGEGSPYVIASREHWLGYQVSSGFDIRAGRMVLPFGIRQPDHTQYVREDFGFDKYDQSYGVELDLRRDGWSLFANVFAGDLTLAPERQDRGVVVTPVLELDGGAGLGVSLLGSTSTAYLRGAGSVFGRVPLSASTYLLAEVAVQHLDAKEGAAKLTTIAEYARLGWFARHDLDVYLELGHRALLEGDGLAKSRAGLGVNWQLWTWFELAPQLLAETRSDLPARVVAMGQLHFVY